MIKKTIYPKTERVKVNSENICDYGMEFTNS